MWKRINSLHQMASFTIHAGSATWTSARDRCTALGSQLAHLSSFDDHSAVTRLLSQRFNASAPDRQIQASGDKFWIGASFSASVPGWRWVDSTPASLFAWAAEQPKLGAGNKTCVALAPMDWRWTGERCEAELAGFVCSSIAPPIAPPSAPPLTDSLQDAQAANLAVLGCILGSVFLFFLLVATYNFGGSLCKELQSRRSRRSELARSEAARKVVAHYDAAVGLAIASLPTRRWSSKAGCDAIEISFPALDKGVHPSLHLSATAQGTPSESSNEEASAGPEQMEVGSVRESAQEPAPSLRDGPDLPPPQPAPEASDPPANALSTAATPPPVPPTLSAPPSFEDGDCVVCLDCFHEGDEVRQLPCGHAFHRTCIDTWLIDKGRPPATGTKVVRGLARCPLCKALPIQAPPEPPPSDTPPEVATTSSRSPLGLRAMRSTSASRARPSFVPQYTR